jgi:ubiquinone/menaquinone biosynthesis C-methylase UbiE
MARSRHTSHKQEFLFKWLDPKPSDYILECGSSSGKTSVDLARRVGCRCLGIDFDEEAVRISSQMRDKYFPELRNKCQFARADLATMRFEREITKILMPDFTEHIPDRVLLAILENIRSQLDNVQLCIYTPSRSHFFEILKHHDFLLRNPPGHINVKTREQLRFALEDAGWKIVDSTWYYSSMWYVKCVEALFASVPFIGKYFQRRIAIKAVPRQRE